MSNEQKKYLKDIKFKKLLILFIQLFIVISFFFLWQLLANKNIINSFIYYSPLKIIKTLLYLITSNNLFNHIFTTLYEVLIVFFLGTFIGIICACMLYIFPTFEKIIDPFLTMINSLPKVALGPLIIIIAGANIKSIIIMGLLINLIISITTIYSGFENVSKNKITLFKSFGSTKSQLLFKLIIPSSFNTIISSLKLNISMSLVGIIMGEFLVSKKGIGYLIIYGTQVFDLNLVMTGVLILIIISFILYKFILIVENYFTKKANKL